jgi:hypothetical protein
MQKRLHIARCGKISGLPGLDLWTFPNNMAREYEQAVIAALSWVWDAQEREAANTWQRSLTTVGALSGKEIAAMFRRWKRLKKCRLTFS